jgi:hypothetical protein
MNQDDQRPPVGVAHVVLQTDRMDDSVQFIRTIGMRSIFDGPEVSVYEMRGGTHLILMRKDKLPRSISWLTICTQLISDLHLWASRHRRLKLAPPSIMRCLLSASLQGTSSHSSRVTLPVSPHDSSTHPGEVTD